MASHRWSQVCLPKRNETQKLRVTIALRSFLPKFEGRALVEEVPGQQEKTALFHGSLPTLS